MYVQGEYKTQVENSDQTEKEREPKTSEMKPIEIVHGYSRDHRPDLKQFIIDMIVTGDGDLPLYLKIDSAILRTVFKQLEYHKTRLRGG